MLCLAVVFSPLAAFQPTPQLVPSSERWALLPFRGVNITEDQQAAVTRTFEDTLRSLRRAFILPQDQIRALLADANVINLQTCDYSLCLADIGKILGVQCVVFGTVNRKGALYTVRIRVIASSDAAIVYDHSDEFSGEFSDLLATHLPKRARDIADTELSTGTKWYVVAAAVAVFTGAAYWIYRSFARETGSENSGGGSPPNTQ